jgi:hypothetical protein
MGQGRAAERKEGSVFRASGEIGYNAIAMPAVTIEEDTCAEHSSRERASVKKDYGTVVTLVEHRFGSKLC